MNIGFSIESCRLSHNISRKELHELSGVSEGYIEEIEHNKKMPTITILLQIAKVFNLTISELIGEVSIRYPENIRNLIDIAMKLDDKKIRLLTQIAVSYIGLNVDELSITSEII